MIFVTVGSMLPFDRLIQVMDDWAASHPETEVFAQIGEGTYEPKHMGWVRTLERQKFDERVRTAELIVAHAGVGSVITALEFQKPIVLVPRYAAAKEHTTDHQLDTAKWLQGRPGVFVAMTSEDVARVIAEAQNTPDRGTLPGAPQEFIRRIREFLLVALNDGKGNAKRGVKPSHCSPRASGVE